MEKIHVQSINYLKALMYLAYADKNIAEKEEEFFYEFARSNNLDNEAILLVRSEITDNKINFEDVLLSITDVAERKNFVKELLSICIVDGNYSIAERHSIKDICLFLDIPHKELVKLEKEAKNAYLESKKNISLLDGAHDRSNEKRNYSKLAFEGGKSLLHSVSNGLNIAASKINMSIELSKKTKEENKLLREELRKTTLTEAVKQKVILQLNAKIVNLKEQLNEEKKRNKKNEEMIIALQSQIEDLLLTLDAAEEVKTA